MCSNFMFDFMFRPGSTYNLTALDLSFDCAQLMFRLCLTYDATFLTELGYE